jgi:hypothetical protein
MLKHQPGNLLCFNIAKINASIAQQFENRPVSFANFGMIIVSVEGGGEIKNRRGEILGVRSGHNTCRIFESAFSRKKKKKAGTLGLDPLSSGSKNAV